MPRKRPFDIDAVLELVRAEIAPFPDAAMFALADAGHRSLFAQLVACVISIRTRDEVSLPASLRLLARAPDPAAVARLDEETVDALIAPATFHGRKAAQIKAIARTTLDDHGGALPCDFEVLTGLPGVGPKCASLALGIACAAPHIAVDIHVHRVTNRWGYVHAPTPEGTMRALQDRLPKAYWIEINRLLVPFGKHTCTGSRPRCSTCPVLAWCRHVGVGAHR